jgi:5-aminolevulinate synthase
MLSHTHVVPVAIGDPAKCKAASDLLLYKHGIYIQPINYPTVPKGTERLRITPTSCHEDHMIAELVAALVERLSEGQSPLRGRVNSHRQAVESSRLRGGST